MKNSSSAKVKRELKAAGPSYCPVLKIVRCLLMRFVGLKANIWKKNACQVD